MKQKSIIFTPTHSDNSTFFVVASTLNEFSFCAALNNEFGIALRMAPSVNETTVHNLYTSNSEPQHIQIDVLVNKAMRSVCVDFLGNIDYIIRVSNISTKGEIQNIQERFSNIEQSVFVQKLDLSIFATKQVKQLQHLFV